MSGAVLTNPLKPLRAAHIKRPRLWRGILMWCIGIKLLGGYVAG
jgi:hypothetical protein